MPLKIEKSTFFDEHRQAKVSSLDRRILVSARHQEILRLQVSMYHPHEMTSIHHIYHLPHDHSRSLLRVAPSLSNSIEQLASRAELHHQAHPLLILKRPLELHHVGLPAEMLQYQHLPPHIPDGRLPHQLPLRYRLAGELPAGGPLGAEVGDAELPPAELLVQVVERGHIRDGPLQDVPNGGRGEGRERGGAQAALRRRSPADGGGVRWGRSSVAEILEPCQAVAHLRSRGGWLAQLRGGGDEAAVVGGGGGGGEGSRGGFAWDGRREEGSMRGDGEGAFGALFFGFKLVFGISLLGRI